MDDQPASSDVEAAPSQGSDSSIPVVQATYGPLSERKEATTLDKRVEPAGEYFDSDFDWNELKEEGQQYQQKCNEFAESQSFVFPGSSAWDKFYSHHQAKFYTPRRFLPLAFPWLKNEACQVCRH